MVDNILNANWAVGKYKFTGSMLGEGDILAICLPGFSLAGDWMARHYPDLYTNRTCYFLDWPGLGEESLEKTPFELSIIKEWVLELVALRPWKQKTIICHSFGARVVLKLLPDLPVFDQLIMIAPVIKIPFWENLIQTLPMSVYRNLVKRLLSQNAAKNLVKIAKKFRLINDDEGRFMQSHLSGATMNIFLKHYAYQIPRLKITNFEINQILQTGIHVKIFLFSKDRFCDNAFWEKISQNKEKCEVIKKQGGHFRRLNLGNL